MNEPASSLVALGFTGLEAEIYTFLLGEPAATGYRVAQAIGKPAANTYKGLEALQSKSAVLVDDDEVRRYRAVNPDELLTGLDRRFKKDRQRASKALSQYRPAPADERLYQLSTRDQVMEKAHAVICNATDILLVDAADTLLHELRDDLESASAQGLTVIVKAYEPIRIKGVQVIARPRGNEITGALPGDLLGISADGSEHLQALLPRNGDAVFQAIWTRSPVVAFLSFTGLINEISFTAVMAELERDASVASIRKTVNRLRKFHPISTRGPAYKNLMRRIGHADPEEKKSPANTKNGKRRKQNSKQTERKKR